MKNNREHSVISHAPNGSSYVQAEGLTMRKAKSEAQTLAKMMAQGWHHTVVDGSGNTVARFEKVGNRIKELS